MYNVSLKNYHSKFVLRRLLKSLVHIIVKELLLANDNLYREARSTINAGLTVAVVVRKCHTVFISAILADCTLRAGCLAAYVRGKIAVFGVTDLTYCTLRATCLTAVMHFVVGYRAAALALSPMDVFVSLILAVYTAVYDLKIFKISTSRHVDFQRVFVSIKIAYT